MPRKSMATREDLEFMLVNELAEPKPLPYSLLQDITKDFAVEIGRGQSAVVYKGSIGNHMVAVKKLFVAQTQLPLFDQEIKVLLNVKHKNVVRFLGYCSDALEFFNKRKGKIYKSKTQERLLCFEYLPATLYNYIEDASRGLIWRQCYQIIVGVCQGLNRLHENNIIHGDLKPQNILLDDKKFPKIADFGLAKCLYEVQVSTEITHRSNGTRGYMAPELLCGVANNEKSDLYSLGVIIGEILHGRLEAIDNVLHSYTKRFGKSLTDAELDQIKECRQIGIECSDGDPTKRPDTKQILERLGVKDTQETQEGLHVQPTVLVFVFDSQPGKLIPCPLQLTNDTDQHMAFKLSTTQSVDSLDWSEHFMIRLPLYGIVPARSTYTLVLTVSEWKVPTKRNCDMIMQSCISPHNHITKFKGKKEYEEYFEVHKAANEVHEVKLNAFLSEKGQSTSPQQTEPRVRILSVDKQTNTLYSMDAHPTSPWIITGHDFGHVRIWNHETKILLNSFKVSLGPVYSVKFIARKDWFICGSAEGHIHVYSYENKIRKITSFKVHDGLMSLAVHPTKPYVLSWPCSRHHQKKLWDWEEEKEWKCIQTFETEYFVRDFVCHVAFDTKDTNRFASTWEHTVKVWSLDSVNFKYTLTGHFNQVNFLEFFTRDDRQYLITGSHDMTAAIWDMQTKEYVPNKLQTSVLPVASVFSHPNLPILLTCSTDGTCHLWSSKDFRLEAVLDYGYGGDVRGISCLMGSKRSKPSCLYVIGQQAAITILDIENGKYQKDSMQSSDPRSYTDTREEETISEVITQGSNELLHIHPMELLGLGVNLFWSPPLPNKIDAHVAFRLGTEEGLVWKHPLTSMPIGGIVHPMKLHFPFQAHKVNLCSLHLTNISDAHVAFRLSTEEGLEWWKHPFARMPLGGIVPSRSTYTLVVITRELPNLEKTSFNLILQSSISGDRYKYTFKDQSECDQFFKDAEETGNGVPDMTLEAVLSLQGLAMSENGLIGKDLIQVNIWGLFHPAKDYSGVLFSLDADPTESWILTGHRHGNVSLWKCGTQGSHRQGDVSNTIVQRMMSSINAYEETSFPWNNLNTQLDVYSVKFITRKRWFVAGTCDGFIHVYNYETRMDRIDKVKVHLSGIRESGIYLSRALVIHPTKSYVLSTFEEMKLLDWEDNWKCIRTFEREHSGSVRQVAFNPEITNTFASASSDYTIKLWRLDSSTSEHTLLGHSSMVNCLEFFKCAGQQYLISGSQDCTARIWDLKEKECVRTVDVFMSPVISVTSLPDASYLTTGSEDGTVHLWSCASFSDSFILKLERIFNIGCGGPVQSLCLMGSKRVVIQQEGEISIMDIDTISETSVSALPKELIQVEPPELRFPIVEEVSSPLKISNITSHHVAFSVWSSPKNIATYSAFPPKGIISPKLTLQVVVTKFAHKFVPADHMHEEEVFLRGIIVEEGLKTEDVTYDMFEPKTGRIVHDVHHVKLAVTFVASEIISKVSLPWTLDVHPTKPWIMTTQGDYHIHIWDYDTKKAKSIAIKGKEVTSAKFIACNQWIAAGSSSGLIYVYSFDPVKKIKVLREHSKSVNSLAVHPTMPCVLSASQDGQIFIWTYKGNDWKLRTIVHAKSLPKELVEFDDYGNDWMLMKKVGAKSLSVEQVAFPKETDMLASAHDMFASAQDKTVKLWDRDSGKCKHILSGHSDLVVCLDYFSLGGKLHLITGSQDKTAKIWDLETEKCVRTLKGHMDVVKVACCHPDLPILITGSRDGSVRLWDSKTFRHQRTLNLGLGEVYAISSLKRSTRIAIANEKGLALVEIGLEDKDDTVTIMGSEKEISSSTSQPNDESTKVKSAGEHENLNLTSMTSSVQNEKDGQVNWLHWRDAAAHVNRNERWERFMKSEREKNREYHGGRQAYDMNNQRRRYHGHPRNFRGPRMSDDSEIDFSDGPITGRRRPFENDFGSLHRIPHRRSLTGMEKKFSEISSKFTEFQ